MLMIAFLPGDCCQQPCVNGQCRVWGRCAMQRRQRRTECRPCRVCRPKRGASSDIRCSQNENVRAHLHSHKCQLRAVDGGTRRRADCASARFHVHHCRRGLQATHSRSSPEESRAGAPRIYVLRGKQRKTCTKAGGAYNAHTCITYVRKGVY